MSTPNRIEVQPSQSNSHLTENRDIMKNWKKYLFYLGFIFFLYVAYNTVLMPEQMRVRRRVRRLRRAVIRKDHMKTLGFISTKYEDEYGLSFPVIFSNLETFYESVEIDELNLHPLSVLVNRKGDIKTAIAHIRVSGHVRLLSAEYELLNEYNDKTYIAEIRFVKERGRWKIAEFLGIRQEKAGL